MHHYRFQRNSETDFHFCFVFLCDSMWFKKWIFMFYIGFECFQGTDVFLGFWPFGNALCKTVVSIDYYNMFTSTFTLTVMSMDRYVAVCHPVKALDMRTPHKAKVRSMDFRVSCLLYEIIYTSFNMCEVTAYISSDVKSWLIFFYWNVLRGKVYINWFSLLESCWTWCVNMNKAN